MLDLISIIIPVYKAEKNDFLRCINSCLKQTHNNIEILIVENGKDENMSHILDEVITLDERIKVFHNDKKGVVHARNYGIEVSNGEWICFLDADDYIENTFCEKLYSHGKDNYDIVVSSFNKVYDSHIEKVYICENDSRVNINEFLVKLLNVQCGVGFCWGKLWRTSFLKDNKIVFNSSLSLAEDVEFVINSVGYNPNVFFVKEPLYYYIFSTSSAVRSFNPQYANEYEKSFLAIKEKLKQYDMFDMSLFSNFVAYHILLISVNYAFNDENGLKYKGQKALLKEVLKKKVYSESLKLCNYDYLSKSRMITLFLLKNKLFLFVKFISMIRHKQR